MKIVVSQTPKKKNRLSKTQRRFDKLIRQVQNQKKLQKKLEDDMEKLLLLYQQQLFPVEVALNEPLSHLCERLIDFFSRKSLSKRQRDELGDWIVETINTVNAYDFQQAKHLTQQFNEVFADFIGVSIEDLTVSIEDEAGKFNQEEQPEKSSKAQKSEDDFIQEDLFGFDDIKSVDASDSETGTNADNEFFDDDPFEIDTEADLERKEGLMNGQWIRKLFRQTAQALHPDKEQDPKHKEKKQALMAELLSARKREDVMTILTLYNEYVDANDIAVAEDEMQEICRLLENQLDALENERIAYLYENPQRQYLYEQFYSKTEKGRQKKLKQAIADTQDEIQEINQLIDYLRNLTCLKHCLQQRTEHRLDAIDFLFMDADLR